jgi:hypothetical protein
MLAMEYGQTQACTNCTAVDQARSPVEHNRLEQRSVVSASKDSLHVSASSACVSVRAWQLH